MGRKVKRMRHLTKLPTHWSCIACSETYWWGLKAVRTPTDDRFDQWMDSLQITGQDSETSPSSYVCEKHFPEGAIDVTNVLPKSFHQDFDVSNEENEEERENMNDEGVNDNATEVPEDDYELAVQLH